MLSNTAAVRLIAGREIGTRIRSRAFRITTVVMLVVVVGFPVILKLIGGDSSRDVGFTPSAAPLAPALVATAGALGRKVQPRTVDQAAGEAMLRHDELDALVTGTPGQFTVVVRKNLAPELRNALQVLARQLVLNQQITRVGANPATVSTAVDAARVDVSALEPSKPYQTERLVLGLIAGILIYLTLVVYGQAVAQGVVEEKTSRVVELLLSTIRPWQLMLGKVVGIGLLGLVQMALVTVIGVVVSRALGVFDFPVSIAAGASLWALLWFLLGYTMYALVFAGLGALVSRQEDVGPVVMPAMMLIVVPYVLGSSILPRDPDNALVEWLSLVPFFSPTLMSMRAATGVPAWQGVLSVVLSLALIAGLVWLAGRIYRNAVLRTGSRVALREALHG
jgi:ABC-2 type transport system permease protein